MQGGGGDAIAKLEHGLQRPFTKCFRSCNKIKVTYWRKRQTSSRSTRQIVKRLHEALSASRLHSGTSSDQATYDIEKAARKKDRAGEHRDQTMTARLPSRTANGKTERPSQWGRALKGVAQITYKFRSLRAFFPNSVFEPPDIYRAIGCFQFGL